MIAVVEKFPADTTGPIGEGLIAAGLSFAIIAVLDDAGARSIGKLTSIDHSSKQNGRPA
jgi:hypothetical protein